MSRVVCSEGHLSGALAPLANDQWLLSRALSGKTVIAGTIVRKNRHVTVKASQVFVQQPDRTSACPEVAAPACESNRSARYTITPDHCIEPTCECGPILFCRAYVPACEAGYRQRSYRNGCTQDVCEPELLEE